MRMVIENKPDEYDSNVVRWIMELDDNVEVQLGFGYQSKDDGRIHVTTCPQCQHENYSLQVVQGACYKCGFDPNKKEETNG